MKKQRIIIGIAAFCALLATSAVAFEESPFAETTPLVTPAPSQQAVSMPVLMYHGISPKTNQWGRKYTISPEEFESDLKYLQKEGFHSITTEQLLRFVDYHEPLPENPILLTFDDGGYNNAYYAEPLMKQYGFCAIEFVIGVASDASEKESPKQNPLYSHLFWAEQTRMVQDGVWEIGNHTYNLHDSGGRGVRKRGGESKSAYAARIRKDFLQNAQKIEAATGKFPTAFAYPFGAMTPTAETVLKEIGVRMTFSCWEVPFIVHTGKTDDLYKIPRYLRPGGGSAKSVIEKYRDQQQTVD